MSSLDTEALIAQRLGEARARQGWTLAKAASEANVSVAHLSRLEKGVRQPSIGLLIQLARAYRVSLGELVGEERDASVTIVRGADAPLHDGPDGRYASLNGSTGRHLLEAVRLHLEANASTSASSRHDGEEWLFVQTGELALEIGSETNELGPGDAAHFDARVAHQLHNVGTGSATVLLVTAGAPFARAKRSYNGTAHKAR